VCVCVRVRVCERETERVREREEGRDRGRQRERQTEGGRQIGVGVCEQERVSECLQPALRLINLTQINHRGIT